MRHPRRAEGVDLADLGPARSRDRRFKTPVGVQTGLMATPGVILFALLVLLPVGMTLGYSFTDQNFLSDESSWVGLANYRRLVSERQFFDAVVNTISIAAVALVVPNVAGLGFAYLLDDEGLVTKLLRVLVFIPFILSPVVVGLTFGALLTDNGIINTLLEPLGISSPSWLSDPHLALLSVAGALAWQLVAFATVLYTAGIRAIPKEVIEASALDGATAVRRLVHIVWPLVAPATTVVTLVSLISAFKIYDHVIALTGGGPGRATETVSIAIIETGFSQNRAGLASSMAVFLLLITVVSAVVTLSALRRREVHLT